MNTEDTIDLEDQVYITRKLHNMLEIVHWQSTNLEFLNEMKVTTLELLQCIDRKTHRLLAQQAKFNVAMYGKEK